MSSAEMLTPADGVIVAIAALIANSEPCKQGFSAVVSAIRQALPSLDAAPSVRSPSDRHGQFDVLEYLSREEHLQAFERLRMDAQLNLTQVEGLDIGMSSSLHGMGTPRVLDTQH